MTDQVKPGQVWASKNTGRRITIVRKIDDDYNWVIRRDDSSAELTEPEWRIVDDFVLVVDAR